MCRKIKIACMNDLTKTRFLRIAPKHDTVQDNTSQSVSSSYQSPEFHLRHLREGLWKSMAKPQPTYVYSCGISTMTSETSPRGYGQPQLQNYCAYGRFYPVASNSLWILLFVNPGFKNNVNTCVFAPAASNSMWILLFLHPELWKLRKYVVLNQLL